MRLLMKAAGGVGAFAALCASVIALQAAPALAQPAEPITPRRSDPTPPGEQAQNLIAQANWAGVRRLAEAERRRQAFQNRDRDRQRSQTNPTRGPNDPTGSDRGQGSNQGRRILEGVLDLAADQAPGLPSIDRKDLGQFQTVNVAPLERTRTPVLVPTDHLFVGLRLYSTPISYAAIAQVDNGVLVETIGTLARAIPQGSPATRARFAEREKKAKRLNNLDTDYVISEQADGISLSFSKFNVAYMISVTCETEPMDRRCRDDDYVVSLAKKITLLNEWNGGAR